MTREGKDVEGQLAAHRELLVTMLCALIESGPLSAKALELETLVTDGEEDPGVLPGKAFAHQSARAREMKSIIEQALERAVARQRKGS